MASSGTLGSLVIELGANVARLQSDFLRARDVTDRAISDINVKINSVGANANFSGVSGQVRGLMGDFNALKATVASIAGVSIGIGGAKEVAAIADEYQNIENRVRTTVDSAAALRDMEKRVFDAAQSTGGVWEDSAKMYQRLEQVIEGSGKSRAEAQAEAIRLTKTLNQEIVVSGVSAGEASRSIMDLVHGIGGGVVHAQQLRPIMRQFPDLVKQIADGFGVSTQKFEEMVKAGIPAKDLLAALESRAGDIDKRFQALPMTFARVWTQLSNSVTQYIGQTVQASAVSGMAKDTILSLSRNIDTVAAATETAAIATGIWLGGRTLSTLGGMSLTLRDMALAQGQYKSAAVVSAEADIANAQATVVATVATRERVFAIETLKLAELDQAQATRVALQAEVAQLEAYAASAPVGVTYVGTLERLRLAKMELVAADTAVVNAETAVAGAEARVILAQQGETAASLRLAAAKGALGMATVEATGAMAAFGRVGGTLFTMIGGWPTLLFAAGAGIYYLYQQQTAAEKATVALKEATDELAASTDKNRIASLQAVVSTQMQAEKELKAAEATLARAEANQKLYESQARLTAGSGAASGGIGSGMIMSGQADLAQMQVEKQRQNIAKLREQILSADEEQRLAQMRIDRMTKSSTVTYTPPAGAKALKAQENAYENLKNSQLGQIATLREAIDGTSGLSAEQRKLNEMLAGGDSSFRKLSAAEKSESIDRQKTIVALKQEEISRKSAADQIARQTQAMQQLQDQLVRLRDQQQTKYTDELDGLSRGSQFAKDAAERRQLLKEYDNLQKQAERDSLRDTKAIRISTLPDADKARGIQAVKGTLEKENAAIREAYQQALRDQDAYIAERTKREADWKNGVSAALEDYVAKAENVASMTADAFTSAFSGMEDAVVNFAKTGKLNFKDFATSVLSEMLRIETRVLASQALKWLLSSFLPGGQYGSSISTASADIPAPSFGSANGNVFSFGNLTHFANGGAFTNSVASTPTMAPMALFGEAGPEAIMPLSRGKDGKLGVRSSGGGGGQQNSVTVIVQVDNSGSGGQSQSSSGGDDLLRQFGSTMAQVAKQQLVIESRQGGLLWRLQNGR